MKVAQFIEWLKTQPQHLEVGVVHYEEGDYSTEIEMVCFDDPHNQSSKTDFSLTLGVIL